MKVRLVCCLSSLKSVLRPTGDRLRETFSIYTWLSSFERWLIEANPVLDKRSARPAFLQRKREGPWSKGYRLYELLGLAFSLHSLTHYPKESETRANKIKKKNSCTLVDRTRSFKSEVV